MFGKKMRRLFAAGLYVTLLTVFCSAAGAQAATGLKIGNTAPDFSVKRVDGSSVKLSDLRGKPVMLHFWATWCPPCVRELPFIAAVAKNRSEEITVLAISAGEDMKTVSDYLKKRGGDLASLNSGYDDDASISILYRVNAVPMTLFLDSSGVIIDGQAGAYTEQRLKDAVDRAVGK